MLFLTNHFRRSGSHILWNAKDLLYISDGYKNAKELSENSRILKTIILNGDYLNRNTPVF